MNKEFQIYDLQDLCIDIIDCPHTTPKWKDYGITVIRNYNIKDGKLDFSKPSYVDESTYTARTKRGVPEYNDLIISREAPMGAVALIPKNLVCCLGQRLVLLKINKEVCNPKYLLYVMQSKYVKDQIKQIDKTGSIVSNLNIGDLKKLKIPIIKEQEKVSLLLSKLDKKIETNNKINKNLEAQLQLLYDYWFTQFDFPDENNQPYQSSGGKMVWSDELNREIPEGWGVESVTKLLDIITGKENANHATINGKYKFFTCSQSESKCDDYKFNGKAILIAGNGDFNVKHYSGKFNAYQRTYVLIPKNDIYYAAIYLVSKGLINKFKSGSNGSIVKFITKGDVENIKIIVPNNLEYYKILNKIIENIEINRSENEKLISLRDFLLPLLMNGQAKIVE